MDLEKIRTAVERIRERNADGGVGSGPPMGNQNAYKGGPKEESSASKGVEWKDGNDEDRIEQCRAAADEFREHAFDQDYDIDEPEIADEEYDDEEDVRARAEYCEQRAEAIGDYDKEMRPESWKAWNNATDEEKQAAVGYTGDNYTEMNSICRNGEDSKYADNYERINEENERLESMINKSELTRDTVLYRGMSQRSLCKMFGVNDYEMDWDPKSIVGKTGTDKGFGSCGSVRGTGSTNKEIDFRILAPKGTKALYAEPFSRYGSNYGSWEYERQGSGTLMYDVGETDASTPEFETIMQRGTSYQILESRYYRGRYRVTAIVTGQG